MLSDLNDVINVIFVRINTLNSMLADDVKRLVFSGDYFKENLLLMQKDYDTLRMLAEIAFEINNLEDKSPNKGFFLIANLFEFSENKNFIF